MAGSSKRIAKELGELTSNPPPGMKVSLTDESDIHKWKVMVQGPRDSPFSGGVFELSVVLPNDYPFKPPVVSFVTKIYHPNVSNDDKGSMCLGLLRPDVWKPPTKLADVLRFTVQIMQEPNPDDAVEQSIAAEYKDNNAEWRKIAKDWTKKYANPSR